MTQRNVDTVRRIYHAWSQGDFRGGVDHLDQYVIYIVPTDFPEFGVFVGPDGVREYMRRILEQWELLTLEALNLRTAGDTVVADVVQHGKGRVSGLQGDQRYFQLFTFRARKIVRIETVRHEAEALEAAGLQRNEDLARALISSWGHGDYSSAEWAHPEIEFVIADGPEPGRWTGLRGMAEGWGQVLSAWEGFHGAAEAYHELDDERVLVFNRFGGRGKTSGLEVGEVGVQSATILHFRDGKVTRLAVYWDRERALRDLGLPVPE